MTGAILLFGWGELGYDLTDWALPLRLHGIACIHLLCFHLDLTKPGKPETGE